MDSLNMSEPRIYVNTHHKASAEGLEMTWNGLQGSALHSFTKGRASEKLMSRRVRSSDAKEKNCGTVGSVFTESVWLIERSCNRFSADFCLCSSEENCFHSTTKTDGHSGRALAAPCNYENSVPSRGRPRYILIILSNNYQYTSS